MAREHSYYGRKPKPCLRCNDQTCMPSTSYCKACHFLYNKKRIADGYKRPHEKPEENFVNEIIADHETVYDKPFRDYCEEKLKKIKVLETEGNHAQTRTTTRPRKAKGTTKQGHTAG